MADATEKTPKAPAAHPTFAVMIVAAITALKGRNGASRPAIFKYIVENYTVGDPEKAQLHVRKALRKLIDSEKVHITVIEFEALFLFMD